MDAAHRMAVIGRCGIEDRLEAGVELRDGISLVAAKLFDRRIVADGFGLVHAQSPYANNSLLTGRSGNGSGEMSSH
jgi:hypothetical protein